MATALKIIPAGARQVAPNTYQLPRRHTGGGRARGRKHGHAIARRPSKHSFFSRQWVWYAVALALADALGSMLMAEAPAWLSLPAMFLFAYGTWKKKPGAINAAYALQGAHLLAYWGVTSIVKEVGSKTGFFKNTSADAGGGGGGGGGVKLDSHTIGNAIKNATGVAQVAGEVAAFV